MKPELIIFIAIAIGLTYVLKETNKKGWTKLPNRGGRIAVAVFLTGILYAIFELIF